MATPLVIPSRPFATDPLFGMMLPDGIFEASLGRQKLNIYLKNDLAYKAPNGIVVSITGISDPNIAPPSEVNFILNIPIGASTLLTWDIDVSRAAAGTPTITFHVSPFGSFSPTPPPVDPPFDITAKIIVTRVSFDPSTKTFTADAPEGTISAHFIKGIGPAIACGQALQSRPMLSGPPPDIIAFLSSALAEGKVPSLDQLCLPVFLVEQLEAHVTYNPGFTGQYGPLPFQDPWWKTLLIVIVILAYLALICYLTAEDPPAAPYLIYDAVTQSGDWVFPAAPCCKTPPSDPYPLLAVAGVIAAAIIAILVAYGDARDPYRRGEDATLPAEGEVTQGERLSTTLNYIEPVALGESFLVRASWTYERLTSGANYSHSATDEQRNTHVLSSYTITAPNILRVDSPDPSHRTPYTVQAQFFDENQHEITGPQLFVQAFLLGRGPLKSQHYSFLLQDNGIEPDTVANDGTYTGTISLGIADRGFWDLVVIAQDVNNATPDMSPEQAAQIIGGMVRTHQLKITFDGGTCPMVPDGELHVI